MRYDVKDVPTYGKTHILNFFFFFLVVEFVCWEWGVIKNKFYHNEYPTIMIDNGYESPIS